MRRPYIARRSPSTAASSAPSIYVSRTDFVHLAAMGTVHFQHCLPGCAQTLHIGLDASRRLMIGFGADEKKRGHDGAPWLVQAGARLVSLPPTPGAVPLPVMMEPTPDVLGSSVREATYSQI
jgi:hypothetical protein